VNFFMLSVIIALLAFIVYKICFSNVLQAHGRKRSENLQQPAPVNSLETSSARRYRVV
jgi:hypothetical protein